MKNKFIINNNLVPFVDISTAAIKSDVTNTLINDMSSHSFFISNSQIKFILTGNVITNVNIYPIKSNLYNNDYFTNIKNINFNYKLNYVNDNIKIPTNITDNTNSLCTLTLDFISGAGLESAKDSIYKVFSDEANGNTLHVNDYISEYLDYYGTEDNRWIEFDITIDYRKNVFVNIFSFTACNNNPKLYSILPVVTIRIYGYNSAIHKYEFISHHIHNANYASNPKYLGTNYNYLDISPGDQRDSSFNKIAFDNVPFSNNKKYSKYKLNIKTGGFNSISHFKLSQSDKNIFENTEDIHLLAASKIGDLKKLSNITDIQEYGYILKNDTLTEDKSYILLKDINIENVAENLNISFYMNKIFNESFKYGNIISSIDSTIVILDMFNYNTFNDMTSIATATSTISNIDNIVNLLFNNINTSDFVTTYNENVGILFTINYDISKYDQLFNENIIETLDNVSLINNYDYNLKLSNINTYSSKLPKKIITYKYVTPDIINSQNIKILKNVVNTINVHPSVKSIDIYAQGENFICDLYKLGSALNDDNKILYPQFYYESGYGYKHTIVNVFSYLDFNLIGMLEISQCTGTSIIKKDFYNGNTVINLDTNNNASIVDIMQHPEHLNLDDAFKIYLIDDIYEKTTVDISNINILSNTKYLIIKLFVKIDTNTRSINAISTDLNIYKTISMGYTINSLIEEHMCNNINEIQTIVSDKNVMLYNLSRGVNL